METTYKGTSVYKRFKESHAAVNTAIVISAGEGIVRVMMLVFCRVMVVLLT